MLLAAVMAGCTREDLRSFRGVTEGEVIRLAAPVAGAIKLFRDGKLIQEAQSDKLDSGVNEAGVYRAEVWLTVDGEQRPWIYANPIRVVANK